MQKKKTASSFYVIFISSCILFSAFIFTTHTVKGDVWSDDFTGTVFDARWTDVGTALCALDGDTNYFVLSFHDEEIQEGVWHGGIQRANLSLCYEFNISTRIDCVAKEISMGKAEVRLLDQSENVVYSFSWSDRSDTESKGAILLNGIGGPTIYSTGDTFDYSIFIDKTLRLERTDSQVYFYIDNVLKYNCTAVSKSIAFIELAILKWEVVCPVDTLQYDDVSVDTTPATAPDVPINVSSNVGDGFIDLFWSPPLSDGNSPITSNKIYRGTISGGEQYLTTVGNVLSYNDTSVSNGQTYYYKISAVNDVGESPLSIEVNGLPRTVPDAIRNINMIIGESYINLSWEEPLSDGGAAITDYEIHRGEVSGSEILIATIETYLFYNDTGLTTNQEYYYRIGAVNAVGEGQPSIETMAVPGALPTIPTAPRDLEANVGNERVSLSWSVPLSNGNTPITGYNIYRGLTSGSETLLTSIGNQVTYSDTRLINDEIYFYKLIATNDIGDGPFSDIVNATPYRPTSPSVPLGVQAEAADGQVSLQWDAPLSDGNSPITGYNIYRRTSQEQMALLMSVGNVLNYVDTNVTNGKTYYYMIGAFNSVGEGPPSPFVNVTLERPGSDGDENEEKSSWNWRSPVIILTLLGISFVIALIYMTKPVKPKDD